MQPAADLLAAELARVTFAAPRVPVVTNVEAAPNQDAARVAELLTRQVTGSVRWEESVQRIAALGVTSAVEVGAGNVIAGLVKRIAPGITVEGAGDPAAIAALGQSPVAREAAHG
jgi:[acyl-carrier-protein] S-malonyltransferase